MQHVVSVESWSLLLRSIGRDLFVYRDDSLTSKRVIMRTEQPTKYVVPLQKLRVCCARKTSLSPQLFNTDRSNAVVLLWFIVASLLPVFWCQSFCVVSPYVCSYYFSSVSVA